MTPADMRSALREHCRTVISFMARGYLIPFLGAGASLSNRPPHASFIPGQYLPNAAELSENIAVRFGYPWADKNNLSHVSWWVASAIGEGPLYQHLNDIFSLEYPLTDVHRFIARLPRTLAAKGYGSRHQLIITTNYDPLLERAFDEVDEPYDLLSYVAHSDDARDVGKFRYLPFAGEPQIVYDPNIFNLTLDRTVILKIHGAADPNWKLSSFVVTEEDYINYLTRMNVDSYQIPAVLKEKMIDRSFLFLGYRLGDWDMRALLKRINRSWAILNQTEPSDEFLWRSHSVQLIQMDLSDYVNALNEELDALPDITGGVSP